MFRKGLAINFIGEGGKDKNGRVVWSLVEINTKVLLIIGVYAPSQGDNPEFFKDEVFPILDSADYDHVIIGGDWNLGMDESLDYYGYANTDPVRPKSRLELHKQIEHYDLLDIYRELHPTPSSGDKTWRAWNKARRKAEKEARLDYFIVDRSRKTYPSFKPYVSLHPSFPLPDYKADPSLVPHQLLLKLKSNREIQAVRYTGCLLQLLS